MFWKSINIFCSFNLGRVSINNKFRSLIDSLFVYLKRLSQHFSRKQKARSKFYAYYFALSRKGFSSFSEDLGELYAVSSKY